MKRLFVLYFVSLVVFVTGCTNFDFSAHRMKCSTAKPCVNGFKCLAGVCVSSDRDVHVGTDLYDVKKDAGPGLDVPVKKDVKKDLDLPRVDEVTRKCGNGTCDHTENCITCPADCGCTDGAVCSAGKCVFKPGDVIDADADITRDVPGDDGTGEDVSQDPGQSAFCGDGTCNAGENCKTCPGDCGCPNGQVCYDTICCTPETCESLNHECGSWDNGCGGTADCGGCEGQGTNYSCDTSGKCKCDIQCAGKDCGDNGCGGVCGQCGDKETCVAGKCQSNCGNNVCGPDENCATCPADCGCKAGLVCFESACCTPGTCDGLGFECGEHQDNCGGTLKCGACSKYAKSYCDSSGHCQCSADCVDKECGDNGCGGICGDCAPNQTCDLGTCTCPGVKCNNECCKDGDTCYENACCTPGTCESLGFECGIRSDGCGSTIDCGKCEQYPNSYCAADGKCKCLPDCRGKACGDDGCGGSCGSCNQPLACSGNSCVCPEPHICSGSCCSIGDFCFQDACQTPVLPVVPTGQKTCVGSIGESDCPDSAGGPDCGTSSYCGQDTQYSKPVRQWIQAGTAQQKVVVDSLTNIAYQTTYVSKSDYQHAIAYCNSLNYGGYSDWMLPGLRELLNMVDYGKFYPSADTSVFELPINGQFWSSTGQSGNADFHWTVSFIDGSNLSVGDTTKDLYVRCVRINSVTIPASRFNKESSGSYDMFTDLATGLIWNTNFGSKTDWKASLSFCESMDCCGHTDWRLPDINEIRSLLNMSNSNPATDFPNFPVASFWSSTHSGSDVKVLKTDFSTGAISLVPQSETLDVACVRGGVLVR